MSGNTEMTPLTREQAARFRAALADDDREAIQPGDYRYYDTPRMTPEEQDKALIACGLPAINGYWIKRPCPQHAARFELECPACNMNESTWHARTDAPDLVSQIQTTLAAETEDELEMLRRQTGGG